MADVAAHYHINYNWSWCTHVSFPHADIMTYMFSLCLLLFIQGLDGSYNNVYQTIKNSLTHYLLSNTNDPCERSKLPTEVLYTHVNRWLL